MHIILCIFIYNSIRKRNRNWPISQNFGYWWVFFAPLFSKESEAPLMPAVRGKEAPVRNAWSPTGCWVREATSRNDGIGTGMIGVYILYIYMAKKYTLYMNSFRLMDLNQFQVNNIVLLIHMFGLKRPKDLPTSHEGLVLGIHNAQARWCLWAWVSHWTTMRTSWRPSRRDAPGRQGGFCLSNFQLFNHTLWGPPDATPVIKSVKWLTTWGNIQ